MVADDDLPELSVIVQGDIAHIEGGTPTTAVVMSGIPVDNLIDYKAPIIPMNGNTGVITTAIGNGGTMITFTVHFNGNNMNEPDRSFITGLRNMGIKGVFTVGTHTMILIATDNDPASVTLAAADTSAIAESTDKGLYGGSGSGRW